MVHTNIKRVSSALVATSLALVIGLGTTACSGGSSSSATSTSGASQTTQATATVEKTASASGQEEVQSFANVKVGDTFAFGSYQGKSIGWQVLAVQDGKALIITQEGIDTKPFNTERDGIVWKDCSLRTWLNSDFLNDAFSADQQKKIATTTVVNAKNPYWSTGGSEETQDKLFCLSITEAEQYFDREGKAMCWPSDYALEQGAYTDSNGACCWWLRDSGYDVNQGEAAANVNTEGFIFDSGAYVDHSTYCVRPAMWVTM